jgi:NADH-quinone oxidoreductase subunit A
MQSDQLSYVPILYSFLLAGVCCGTIIVSGKLGPKRKSEIKNKTLNVGRRIGNARIPFSVKYFLVLFVLFDVEVIFLYPWAINFKN